MAEEKVYPATAVRTASLGSIAMWRRGGGRLASSDPSEAAGACLAGFSLLETLGVLTVLVVVLAMALLPFERLLSGYRLGNDARALAGQINLARMRAMADFTQTRLVIDPLANSYHLEVYNRQTGAFERVGASYSLSAGNSFGWGAVSGPAGEQHVLQQSSYALFNSRGIPLDGSGVPTTETAFYLTDNQGTSWAVSVSAAGQVALWEFSPQGWVRQP